MWGGCKGLKDYCVRCDKLKEGYYDNDQEIGTGWFYCFQCGNNMEQAIAQDLQRDYDWFNSLNDEQKAEVRLEYNLAGVKDFPP